MDNSTRPSLEVPLSAERRLLRGMTLRTKLIVVFVITILLSAIAIALVNTTLTRAQLTTDLGFALKNVARSQALTVGGRLEQQIAQLQSLTLNKVIQDEVERANNGYNASASEIRARIERLNAQWRTAVNANNVADALVTARLKNVMVEELNEYQKLFPDNVEVIVTDKYGALVAATRFIGQYDFANQTWWRQSYDDGKGKAYIDQPTFDEASKSLSIHIVVPIPSHNKQGIEGVLRVSYQLKPLAELLNTTRIGQTGQLDLYFPTQKKLAPTGQQLDPLALDAIALDQLLRETADYAELNYAGVDSFVSAAPITTLSNNEAVRNLNWYLLAYQDRREGFGLIDNQLRNTLFATTVITLGALGIAFWVARSLSRPISNLTNAAEKISAGDWSVRANVETRDEIGLLASAFNRMAGQLQQTVAGLEQRVSERTAELAEANQALNIENIVRKRAEDALRQQTTYLSALNDTALGLVGRLDLDELLNDILNRAGNLVGAPHGYIYLLEPNRIEMQLRVGTGVQKEFIGNRIMPGVGLAGQVWSHAEPLVINDYPNWSGRLASAGYSILRAVMGVPLTRRTGVGRSKEEVIGVLGLAHTEEDRQFSEEEVDILKRFAALASVALDNARLFELNQSTLAETQQQRRTLQTILDNLPIGVFVADTKTGAPLLVNHVGVELLGRGIDPSRGKDDYAEVYSTYLPDSDTLFPSAELPLVRTLNTGTLQTGVVDIKRSATSRITVEVIAVPIHDTAGNMLSAIALFQNITERKRAEQQVTLRNQELQTLNQIGQALNTLADPSELVQKVYDQLGQVLDNRNVYIALHNEMDRTLSFPVYYVNGQRREPFTRAYGTGLTEYVIQTRRTLLIPSHVEQKIAELGITRSGTRGGIASKSLLAVPMIAGDKTIGVIAIQDYEREQVHTEAQASLLNTIATQAAIAIENARSFARQRELAEENRQLLEQSQRAVEQLNALTRRLTAEGWDQYLSSTAQEVVVEMMPHGQGTANHANPNGESSAAIASHPSSAQPLIQLPIMLRDEMIGKVELEPDPEQVGGWNDDQLDLLKGVAEHVALAVDNARLFDQTQAALTETQTLYSFSAELNNASNYSDVLQAAIQHSIDSGANAAGLFLLELDAQAQPSEAVLAARWARTATSAMPLGIRYQVAQSPTFKILRENSSQPLIIENIPADTRLAPELRAGYAQANTLAIVQIPLLQRSQWIGWIGISWDQPHEFNERERRLFAAQAGQIAVATQNLYNAELTRQRALQLERLAEAEAVLSKATNDVEILKAVLNAVPVGPTATVYLAFSETDRDDQLLSVTPVAIWQQQALSAIAPEARQSVNLDRFTTAKIWAEAAADEPLLISDTQSDPRTSETMRASTAQAGWQAMAFLPLRNANRWQGLLGFVWSEAHPFSADERFMFEHLIEPVAATVASRRAYLAAQQELVERQRAQAALHQQTEYLTALNDTTIDLVQRLDLNTLLSDILERAGKLLNAPHGYIYLIEPDDQEMQMRVGTGIQRELVGNRIHPGQGLAGQVWQNHAPLVVNDYQNWPGRLAVSQLRAVVGVPLTSGHQVIGVLGLAQVEEGQAFDDTSVNILTRFAQLASVALDNARLFAQTQARARRDQLISEIGGKINSTLDVQNILKLTARQLSQALGASHAIIRLGTASMKETESGSDQTVPPS